MKERRRHLRNSPTGKLSEQVDLKEKSHRETKKMKAKRSTIVPDKTELRGEKHTKRKMVMEKRQK